MNVIAIAETRQKEHVATPHKIRELAPIAEEILSREPRQNGEGQNAPSTDSGAVSNKRPSKRTCGLLVAKKNYAAGGRSVMEGQA